MKTTIKKNSYVRGVLSPFVHGKVESIEGAFVRLDNGGAYPLTSVILSSAKINKTLPDFNEHLRNSKRGLGC